MPQAESNGILIEYDRIGPVSNEPLLLIHGVGAQLIRWPEDLCNRFAAAGFHVIRYDSRDIGLSTHLSDVPVPDLGVVLEAVRRGAVPKLPYTLSDLAADAAGLLRALNIPRAHVLGVSLGGMVAQVLAVEHPLCMSSLNIVMSHTGNPDLPPSDPETMRTLMVAAPDPTRDLEGYLRHSVALNIALGSPAYPVDEAVLREFAVRAARRAYDPAGVARQLAAGRGGPDRRAALKCLTVPTLVIHGANDKLIAPAGGEDIARNIKDAWLLIVNGMAHDLPPQLFDLFVSLVGANARRANHPALKEIERDI